MFQAFILGIVQGLGEFLPISSSAHLIVTTWLFGWEDQGLAFDVALHWGTLLAVVVYFRRDIVLLAKGFFHSIVPSTRNFTGDVYQKLSWLIVLASIPAAIIGKLLESQVGSAFRNPLLIGFTMLGFGIILALADALGKKAQTLNQIRPVHAVLIGLSQALALIPGVSRSGSTMTTGLALGFKRADVARFSFLMSIPITFGAGLLKAGDLDAGADWWALGIGFVTAAVVGFLAIRFLLTLLAKRDFSIFVWYRIAFALVIFTVYFVR